MTNYRQGSLASFELLYARHKGPSFRYFLRQCADQQVAEDLLQELWGKVIKGKDSYRQQALFTTWFYTIAHHLVVDHHRRFTLLTEPEQQTIAEEAEQPDQQMVQQRLSQQLKHCITKLPSVQLETFLLNQETDLTLAQIAEVVNATKEATKSRLRYAIKALRQCLNLERED